MFGFTLKYLLVVLHRDEKLVIFHLYVDVNTGRHFQSLKSINSLLSGSHDVDQSLVSSLLELFSGVLVLVYLSLIHI